jgi:hypothetical protein
MRKEKARVRARARAFPQSAGVAFDPPGCRGPRPLRRSQPFQVQRAPQCCVFLATGLPGGPVRRVSTLRGQQLSVPGEGFGRRALAVCVRAFRDGQRCGCRGRATHSAGADERGFRWQYPGNGLQRFAANLRGSIPDPCEILSGRSASAGDADGHRGRRDVSGGSRGHAGHDARAPVGARFLAPLPAQRRRGRDSPLGPGCTFRRVQGYLAALF